MLDKNNKALYLFTISIETRIICDRKFVVKQLFRYLWICYCHDHVFSRGKDKQHLSLDTPQNLTKNYLIL